MAFIATAQTQAAKPPLPYDAINHHYYTVKINNLDVTSPQEIARHLGVEYVGQVGELKQYHLFSYEKTTHEKRADVTEFGQQQFNASSHDIILERYQQLKESKAFHRELLQRTYASQLSKRGEAGQGTIMNMHPLGPIDKQVLRQRVKRELVINVDRRDEHVKGETQPLDGTAAHFAIKDPGFQYQWHLVSVTHTALSGTGHGQGLFSFSFVRLVFVLFSPYCATDAFRIESGPQRTTSISGNYNCQSRKQAESRLR
jgi:kexin